MENNNNEKKIKPFSMIITDDDIRSVEGEEAVERRHENLQKVFTVDETVIKEKEYLLLLEFVLGDNEENERNYEFITGTTEKVYDYIKGMMFDDNIAGLDVMHSYVIVDSPKVSISKRITIYKFMKNAIVTGRVIDESGFDIEEYYYEDPDENEEE